MKLFGKKKKKNEDENVSVGPEETSPVAQPEAMDDGSQPDPSASSQENEASPLSHDKEEEKQRTEKKGGFFSRFRRRKEEEKPEGERETTDHDVPDSDSPQETLLESTDEVEIPPDQIPAEEETSSEVEETPEKSKKGFLSIFKRKEEKPEPEEETTEEAHDVAETLSEDGHLEDEAVTEHDEEELGAVSPPKDMEDVPGEETEEEDGPPKDKKPGFFKRLRNRLTKTRKAFVNRVDSLLLGKKEIDEELLEELEEILITSDIGVHTSLALIEEVREQVARKALNDPAGLKDALQNKILEFITVPAEAEPVSPPKPHVIMVVGVNGVGKTTTIGKLASRFASEGKQILLVAGDTFRAAAVEQLEIWAGRVGADIVCHKGGADPSAVAFDGIQAAISRNVDVVIIDTAGRLHTKVNLMEELKKMRRTVSKQLPEAPHDTFLVLDATTGQNALSQAEIFNEAMDVTGIVLTKLDGTAKGGVVVGICHRLGVPLKFIGIGEKVEDLQPFDPDEFMKALF